MEAEQKSFDAILKEVECVFVCLEVSRYSQDSMFIFDLMHFYEMSAFCFMSR